MLVKNCIKGCSTGQIDGLSREVLDRMLSKGILVKIDHKLISCEGRHNNPYLQPKAYKALIKAVEYRGKKLYINSCLRTVMQQYMLRCQYQQGLCGITAAAHPGRSNHQSGLAIDIIDYASWRPTLKRFGWKWIGAWDKWHFDYIYKGADLSRTQIREFQQIWNENNPTNKLKVDGLWGRKTSIAVSNSPAGGFSSAGVLNRGDINKDVGRFQLMLRVALNLTSKELSADCKYGSQTTRAVIAFQKLKGLKQTGIADQETLNTLGFVMP